MEDERPQSQIDHAAMHAIARREMLMSSERYMTEAIAEYHIAVAPYALQLAHILKQTRHYPDMLTDDVRQAIGYLGREIVKQHVLFFGMDPSWPFSPKADKDL